MKRTLNKREKVQISLLAVSVLIMVLGFLFLANAMQENPEDGFFTAFCAIDNILGKYIIVIITMACGIMLFSNVGITFENKKLRDGLTIGITTLSTILTLPLVYVLIAILPYAANPVPFEELNAIDQLMRMDLIYEGFTAWFGTGAGVWVVMVFMMLLSLVFILFPLLTGVLAVRYEKTLGIKKKGFGIIELPVVVRLRAEAEAAANAESEEESDGEQEEVVAEAEPVSEEEVETKEEN